MNWQPTNELRWVERSTQIDEFTGRFEKVLKQKWTIDKRWMEGSKTRGKVLEEWRDVPTVEE